MSDLNAVVKELAEHRAYIQQLTALIAKVEDCPKTKHLHALFDLAKNGTPENSLLQVQADAIITAVKEFSYVHTLENSYTENREVVVEYEDVEICDTKQLLVYARALPLQETESGSKPKDNE